MADPPFPDPATSYHAQTQSVCNLLAGKKSRLSIGGNVIARNDIYDAFKDPIHVSYFTFVWTDPFVFSLMLICCDVNPLHTLFRREMSV